MRKISLFIALFALLGFTLNAKPINQSVAQKVAEHFLFQQTGNIDISLTFFDYFQKEDKTQDPFYVFINNELPAFVIVSGDDDVTPILGYAIDNEFAKPGEAISPEVQYWLSGYEEQIKEIEENSWAIPLEITDEWTNLLAEPDYQNGFVAQKGTAVSPFVTTRWNQLPYYNDLCPATPYSASNPTRKAPAGCVATAMAQIMKYWDYPTKGTGSATYSTSPYGGTLSANFGNTTYQWSNMPRALNQNSSAAQVSAVATISYHAGVAVRMSYGATASGAYVINYGYPNLASSENVFPLYFGYSKDIAGYQRGQFSATDWMKMLKFEIDNGRPILYAGQGQAGGHAFIFDGYNNNDYFHVNWGWGGSSDGYFVVSQLNPSSLGAGGGSGGFNSNQEALVMIQPSNSTLPKNPYKPSGSNSSSSFKLITTNSPSATKDKIYLNESYSITCNIRNNGPSGFSSSQYKLAVLAMDTITKKLYLVDSKAQNLNNGQSYTYKYSTSSFEKLNPGIYYIIYGYINNSNNAYFITTSSGSVEGEILRVFPKKTNIEDVDINKAIAVYPNPVDDELNIKLSSAKETLKQIQLFDEAGRLVFETQNIDQQATSIKTNTFASGQYHLKIHTSKGIETQKVIIKH